MIPEAVATRTLRILSAKSVSLKAEPRTYLHFGGIVGTQLMKQKHEYILHSIQGQTVSQSGLLSLKCGDGLCQCGNQAVCVMVCSGAPLVNFNHSRPHSEAFT